MWMYAKVNESHWRSASRVGRRLLCVACVALYGCGHTSKPSPYAAQVQATRDSLQAQRLTQEAAAVLKKDPARAERLLLEALGADLFHGPAHNNLGVVYLQQGKLYEAAGEFEWARKLMPGSPEPRVNLAATLERAGRTEEALANYEAALEAAPGSIGAMQGLTRLQVRAKRMDDRTPGMLQEIAMRGETEHWRTWARMRLTAGEGASANR